MRVERKRVLAWLSVTFKVTGVPITVRHPSMTQAMDVMKGLVPGVFRVSISDEFVTPGATPYRPEELDIVIRTEINTYVERVSTFETYASPAYGFEVLAHEFLPEDTFEE